MIGWDGYLIKCWDESGVCREEIFTGLSESDALTRAAEAFTASQALKRLSPTARMEVHMVCTQTGNSASMITVAFQKAAPGANWDGRATARPKPR